MRTYFKNYLRVKVKDNIFIYIIHIFTHAYTHAHSYICTHVYSYILMYTHIRMYAYVNTEKESVKDSEAMQIEVNKGKTIKAILIILSKSF